MVFRRLRERESLMPDNIQTKGTIRFGEFELDHAAGELRKNGSRVRLQEQPLQVLETLLETPGGEVVPKIQHARSFDRNSY
jgi:DNA-binding winged helix-turn-helix (wHTH) protein